jgi:DNA-binding response OmpR family regulator
MLTKPTVAIAEDNPVASQVLQTLLEDDFEVQVFRSGQAALDALAQRPVDLLLLDVGMPGLDGYETCRLLRSGTVQPDLPVIFLSGRVNIEDRLLGYAAGGNDYLVKPYDIDELEAKIKLATEHHRRVRLMAAQTQEVSEHARQLGSEVTELLNVASVTAEMLGETGVVVDFQRAAMECQTVDALGQAIAAALGRFGFEGCMRLKPARLGALVRSALGAASALERALIEHLAAMRDTRILTLTGQNLGFSFGSVTLLVRCPAWAAAPDAPETVDAMGRARDNVALVVEGAVARLQGLDVAHDAGQFAGAQRLIATTREALLDIEQQERALYQGLDGLFEAMRDEFEMRFPQLGLTAQQEDSLAVILARHRASALAMLERGRAAEARLHRLVEELQQAPEGAAAG